LLLYIEKKGKSLTAGIHSAFQHWNIGIPRALGRLNTCFGFQRNIVEAVVFTSHQAAHMLPTFFLY